jgi:formylglycine-generating enzyme required for sulfatase activity
LKTTIFLTLVLLLLSLAGCGNDEVVTPDDIPDWKEDLVLIPAGTFMMGSPENEPLREINETQHSVTLTRSFYMFATEVTNRQYADMAQYAYNRGYCTSTNTSLRDALDGLMQELLDLDDEHCEICFNETTFTVDAGKEEHPVKEVTWYGAAAYCDWLSLREGLPRAYNHSTWQCNGNDPYNAQGYRLPTEAEWEYACRAGTQTPFNTGNCLTAGTEANYLGYYPYTGCTSGLYLRWTVPVKSYPVNGYGLYDMHGNLLEWCNDCYGEYSGDVTDPVGPDAGNERLVRGGAWHAPAQYCRSAFRLIVGPTGSDVSVGFRLARSVL